MPSSVSLSIPDLAAKVVLVTGASTGIGAALARAYAVQGTKVGLHYNASRDAAEELATEIRDAGGHVFLIQGDFSVSADVTRRRGDGRPLRPARWAGQQCRRHARPRALCRNER